MRAGDGREGADEGDERAAGRKRIGEERDSVVSLREARAHDAGTDDRDEQEHRAQGFGDEAASEIVAHGVTRVQWR